MRNCLVTLMIPWCALVFSSVSAADTGVLKYTIKRVSAEATPKLEIKLEFTGEIDGVTRIKVPTEWAGQKGYEKGFENIRLVNSAGTLKHVSNSEIELTHKPNEPMVIEYSLKQVWKDIVTRDGFYWPLVQSEYFHFFGLAVFLRPDWNQKAQRDIKITWVGFPESWKLANSHGLVRSVQAIRTSLARFTHAVFLGGDFRIASFNVHGHPVHVALRGNWKFQDSELTALAEKVFRSQREFFQDFEYPHFLVSLLPTDSSCCTRGGTGLTDSFAMHSSKDVPDLQKFKYLLSHELFHNWNGRKIGRQEPEELVYWFSEGFTEYFSKLINLKAGIIDLPEYVKQINYQIERYEFSPEKNASNEKILKEFWTNENITDLPYLRGSLIALYWNAKIKRQDSSKSLDNFMRDLFLAAVTSGAVVEPATLEKIMSKYVSGGVKEDLVKLVDRGDTVPLSPEALGECVQLKTKMIPSFDMGFDVELSFKDGFIRSVKTESNAYRAGLRDGQKLLRVQNQSGNASYEVTVTVETDGAKKLVKYMPAGNDTPVQQYVVDEVKYSQTPEKCLQWFR